MARTHMKPKMRLSTENVIDICKVLSEAHVAILEIYNDENKFDVVMKDVDGLVSPLTAADTKANEIICAGLEKLWPQIPVVSEENKAVPEYIRIEMSHSFIVDPIDGTKEFIKKTGEFTTNIGFVEYGVPVLGFVGVPCKNEIWVGGEQIPFQLYQDGVLSPAPVKKFSEEHLHLDKLGNVLSASAPVRVVTSGSHMNEGTKTYVERYPEKTCSAKGSSLKLLDCALAQSDVYPRMAPTSEWDICAAHAIVRAAGGEVYKVNERQEIDGILEYNKGNVLNPWFLVTGPTVKVDKADVCNVN